MPFVDLPTELHFQILSHLDLPSLLRAVRTNRYLNNLLTDDLLRKALLTYESANPRVLRAIGQRPCYCCLRMLSQTDFFKIGGNVGWGDITAAGIALDRGLRQKRRCKQCDGKDGKKFERAMKNELVQVARGISRVCPNADLRSRSILLIHQIMGTGPMDGWA